MALTRRATLAAFATLMEEISEITTVVRSLRPIDPKQYAQAELPLLNIVEPEEDVKEEEIGMHSLQELTLDGFRLYFLNWGETPSATYETLIKRVRDKLGDNFKVSNTATAALIGSISAVQGRMPLYWVDVEVRIEYYMAQTNT